MSNRKTETYDESGSYPEWSALVDLFYAEAPQARAILLEHSEAVTRKALEVLRKTHPDGLTEETVVYAAMVHDIGIIGTDAPGIGCHGTRPYICHGVVGGDMLRGAGAPEWAARVAERHTGSGLTHEEIIAREMPLPLDRSLIPESTLEKLICYADKFFSKRPGQLSLPKSLEQVRSEMSRHGVEALARFDRLHEMFKAE